MTVVTELALPEIDYNLPGFGPDTYHGLLAVARERNWLAHSPLAYIVLDGESGDFFLRARQTTFPGRQIAELFGITDGPLHENVENNILNLTGDKHRRLRSLIGHAFTPKAADRWRPAMREFLAQLWRDLGSDADAGTEFVSAIAKPYPSRTIAAVLGAPVADAGRLEHWSSMVQRQFDIAALSTQIPDIERAVVEAREYVTTLLEDRRATPGADLISTLLAAEEQGDRLTHDECVNLVLNLLAGGVDTTQSQLSQALRLFAEHPDQWALLAEDPATYVKRAVQEALRFEPIAPFTARIVLEDLEHRGVLFPAGTIVAVCAERANRETPGGEAFDITADRDGKLYTFGAGAHFCLGVNLARAELEEALSFLAPRMPDLALAGDPVLGGIEGIYNVESLPLRWSGLRLQIATVDRATIGWQRRAGVCHTAGMAEKREPPPSRRVWRQLAASPRAALEGGLSPADLQAALLDVSRSRAAAVTPARLMQRWRSDRYVQPVVSDPRPVWQLEARLWALLPDEFAGVDLSPVAPLGTCSAVGPVSQDRVISTTRGSEVVSDPTNVLALEAASRRQRTGASSVSLALCHKVLRGQPFDAPGVFQHFRLFALVTSARDRGSGRTEAAMLTTHLQFWVRALEELLPVRRAAVRYTVFGFPPLRERIRDTVLPALDPLPAGVAVHEDPGRERARGYYERGAIRIEAEADGDWQEVGDGGFTDWTARLLNDAKERCLISCISTERLAAFATA